MTLRTTRGLWKSPERREKSSRRSRAGRPDLAVREAGTEQREESGREKGEEDEEHWQREEQSRSSRV